MTFHSVMLHNSPTGETQEEPLLCQFCEDYSPQRATLACNECTFMYCGTCFDACHPSKGPLADHSIGPPVARPVKRKETSLQCQQHTDEKLALYCVDCKMPVCYLCKEYGKHKAGHKVELLEAVFRNSKVKGSHIITESFLAPRLRYKCNQTPGSNAGYLGYPPKTIRHLTYWRKGGDNRITADTPSPSLNTQQKDGEMNAGISKPFGPLLISSSYATTSYSFSHMMFCYRL